MSPPLPCGERSDWSTGTPRILYLACGGCGSVWYLPKTACPCCGASNLITKESRGFGTLRAKTTIHRAPSPEFEERVPYAIGLIEAAEGFVMMGHVSNELEIGANLQASFIWANEKCLPFFVAVLL